MAQTLTGGFAAGEDQATTIRIARLLNKVVFVSLLLLLVTSAIPYGTVEPWWKAAFVCAVFVICIVAIVESLLSGESRIGGSRGVLLSMLSIAALAFLQTINLRAWQC